MTKFLFFFLIVAQVTFSCKNKVKSNALKTLSDNQPAIQNEGVKLSYEGTLFDGFSLIDTAIYQSDTIFTYGILAKLPELKSTKYSTETLNQAIQSDFSTLINKNYTALEINKEHFRKINYNYYLDDSLLSIVIEDLNAYHLSEATSEFKVYHFDLKNNKILSTADMLEIWGISSVPLLNAISEQITLPPDNTEPLFDTKWFEYIKWKDISQLKIYKTNSQQITVIYPLSENGIEAEYTIQ